MKVNKPAKQKEAPLKTTYEIEQDLDAGIYEDPDQVVHELDDNMDAISAEEDEGDKITFGMTFSPMDGDLGDESEDLGDLPETLIKNRYSQNINTQPELTPDDDELIEKIRITNESKVGLGYGDNDYSKKKK